MLTAAMYLDLSTEPDLLSTHDRKELAALDGVPTGARVVVDIGSRRWASPDVVEHLHRHIDRLNIEIQGTAKADIHAWMDAVRVGHAWVIS